MGFSVLSTLFSYLAPLKMLFCICVLNNRHKVLSTESAYSRWSISVHPPTSSWQVKTIQYKFYGKFRAWHRTSEQAGLNKQSQGVLFIFAKHWAVKIHIDSMNNPSFHSTDEKKRLEMWRDSPGLWGKGEGGYQDSNPGLLLKVFCSISQLAWGRIGSSFLHGHKEW